MREFSSQHPHWRVRSVHLQPDMDDGYCDEPPFDLSLFSGGPSQKEINETREAAQAALSVSNAPA